MRSRKDACLPGVLALRRASSRRSPEPSADIEIQARREEGMVNVRGWEVRWIRLVHGLPPRGFREIGQGAGSASTEPRVFGTTEQDTYLPSAFSGIRSAVTAGYVGHQPSNFLAMALSSVAIAGR